MPTATQIADDPKSHTVYGGPPAGAVPAGGQHSVALQKSKQVLYSKGTMRESIGIGKVRNCQRGLDYVQVEICCQSSKQAKKPPIVQI